MPNIHILPEEVISKIAAGEVIDRPASVLKELIENSLDAGATSIEINLKDAGKTSLLIKDNGRGIEKDDLETCFYRHATSKITNADDLFDIHSLGFRGEALYSIAAVSDVIIRSKTKTQETGFEIHVRGGKKLNLKPCSFNSTGTEIEIKELFFNTPARKKFLKTNASEIYQILSLFTPYTLLHPECRFKLTHQGKDIVDLAPNTEILSRTAHALNLKEQFLLNTKHMDDQKRTFVHVVLGDINIKRTRRDLQFIFVNNRPVFSKNISYHMNQVFRLIMPPGEFPCFAVFLTMPPESVDVNIHPTKKEVKIDQENDICRVLRSICEEALMKTSTIKQVHDTPSENFDLQTSISDALKKSETNQISLDVPTVLPYEHNAPGPSPQREYAFPRSDSLEPETLPSSKESQEELFGRNTDSLREKLSNAKLIGTFINKYLLFESHSSLLLIDQHAAAERITYEKLINQMELGTIEVQPLLSPIIISITPQELNIWEDSSENLNEIGFSTTQWDDQSIAIHSHPNLLKDPEKAVRQLLLGGSLDTSNHDSLARRACRSSIMTGDILQPEKIEFIQEELLNCKDPYTCPHGRPTIIEMTEDYLDRQFLRT